MHTDGDERAAEWKHLSTTPNRSGAHVIVCSRTRALKCPRTRRQKCPSAQASERPSVQAPQSSVQVFRVPTYNASSDLLLLRLTFPIYSIYAPCYHPPSSSGFLATTHYYSSKVPRDIYHTSVDCASPVHMAASAGDLEAAEEAV